MECHISKLVSKEKYDSMVLEVKRIKLSMSLQGNHTIAEVFSVTKLGKIFRKPLRKPLLLIA